MAESFPKTTRDAADEAAGVEPAPLNYATPPAMVKPLPAAKPPYAISSEAIRERIVQGLKTFAWVAPLTLLIWFYAEREQLVTETNYRIPIEIRTASKDRSVTLMDKSADNVLVDIRGPRDGLDKVREMLGREGRLVVTTDLNLGEGSMPIADRIAHSALFSGNAIEVTKCVPDAIRVRVDQLVTEMVPVKGDRDIPGGTIEFQPDKVEVRAAESTIKRLKEAGGLGLVAFADLSKFADRKPERYREDVPVTVHFEVDGFSPKRVMAIVDITQAYRETTIDAVIVWLQHSKGALDQVEVDYPDALHNVVVRGPADKIKAIEDRVFVPRAYLEITSEDVRQIDSRREFDRSPASYYLPKDVSVVDPERPIHVTIRRREPNLP